jgi:hypothetical protein
MVQELTLWRAGGSREAIEDFVARVTTQGSSDFVPPEARIAVFDNDGTLWTEKPMPVELGFILQQLAILAEQDAALREQQPFKAACEKDYAWLGGVITKHYQGDDSDVKVLVGGILKAFGERVIGSSNALCYVEDGECGQVEYLARPDVFDDGPAEPVRIWSRIGRRPILVGGNSDGDIQMLQFAGGDRPALRLLLLHDDAEREFAYTAGAEKSLDLARARGWQVVSMKDEWKAMFAAPAPKASAAGAPGGA